MNDRLKEIAIAKRDAGRARFLAEHGFMRCSNCSEYIHNHASNGCAVHFMAEMVRERESYDEFTILEMHRKCDGEELWDQLGALVDQFEQGGFEV